METTPISFLLPSGGIRLTIMIERLERDLIGQALIRSRGNKAAAARLLGLRRTTMIEKMKRYGYRLLPPVRKFKTESP
jgi:sigma-54 specific flagellar transcriptional regulator A